MRSYRWIAGPLAALALGLLIGGCAATTTPTTTTTPGLGLDAAPWQDGSSAQYEWLDSNGDDVGTSDFSFAMSNSDWVITEIDSIAGITQTAQMTITASTLAPVGEHKTIQGTNTDVTLTSTYASGAVAIEAVVNGQTRTATVDVPSNAMDNDQLLMTLRALPFAEGYSASYVVVVTESALKANVTVTVTGTQQIQVPAGTFQTWHVELTANQSTQSAYYQVDAPHELIEYNNGTNRMLLTGTN